MFPTVESMGNVPALYMRHFILKLFKEYETQSFILFVRFNGSRICSIIAYGFDVVKAVSNAASLQTQLCYDLAVYSIKAKPEFTVLRGMDFKFRIFHDFVIFNDLTFMTRFNQLR